MEILIVVVISALLSTLAITYSRVGQTQVALSVEAAKLSQLILQAKALSIATYNSAGASCGYGVAMNYAAQSYSLFVYSPAGAPPCPGGTTLVTIAADSIKQYAPSSWQVKPAKGIVMASSSLSNDVLTAVLFYPPEPMTIMSRTTAYNVLSPGQTSKIYLHTADNSASAVISVNPAGQVEF